MVDIKLIIIGVVVVLSLWQYASPEKSHDFLEPYYGKVVEFFDFKNPFTKTQNNETTESKCEGLPTNQVCGSDGITYDNACFAVKADIYQITVGAC